MSASTTEPPGPTAAFGLFPALPAELRLKIWSFSFLPRVVEFHGRKAHYADARTGVPNWQSRTPNPPALAVSIEARFAAREHFTVALPLVQPQVFDRPGDSRLDLHRKLYLSPAADTVVVLGELDQLRLSNLLSFIRQRGGELRRLGVSAGCFASNGGGSLMAMYARTIFRFLEELVLFLYNERMPPGEWTGEGPCELVECKGTDYYRRFEMGRGAGLKLGQEWMKVGKKPLMVMDLAFGDGS